MRPKPDRALIICTVYTSYLTVRNVFNHSVTISFKTSTVLPLTINERSRRSCYRQRNPQTTASQYHWVCKNRHCVFPEDGTRVPQRVGEAYFMLVRGAFKL